MFFMFGQNNIVMKITKIYLLSILLSLGMAFQACKTKKIAAKSAPPVHISNSPATQQSPPSPAPPKEDPAPAPAKPDYNFASILFEFNSGVLKTGSYEMLDKVAAEMKKDALAKFMLNGHSSAEGTAEHNQSLSEDRANAVKTYLVNAGVSGTNLMVKGYGESKPATSNKTEEGRAQNRRVEIKLN